MRISGIATAIEIRPKPHVEAVGVWKRGWTFPNTAGVDFQGAIDSVVRAVGRIVVCVDAAAEVRTATIRNFTPTLPSTPCPSALSTSEEFSSLARNPAPWKDWAPAETNR